MEEFTETIKQVNAFKESLISGTFHKRNPEMHRVIGKQRVVVYGIMDTLPQTVCWNSKTGKITQWMTATVKNTALRLDVKPSVVNKALEAIVLASEVGGSDEDKIPDWILSQVKSIQNKYEEERTA